MNKGLLYGLGAVVIGSLVVASVVLFNNDQTAKDVNQTPTNQTEQNTEATNDNTQSTEENVVVYTNTGFQPSNITVSEGTTVTFKNQSDSQMWVASDVHPTHEVLPEFDANRGYSAGESYSYTFDQAGEWEYHNHLAPGDTGTVTVTE